MSDKTGVSTGEGTAYPSGAPEVPPLFSGVCVALSFFELVLQTFVSHCKSKFGQFQILQAAFEKKSFTSWAVRLM